MGRELIDLAVERLREDFPNKNKSWVRRALVRFMKGTVREFNENTWVVRGLPELGDKSRPTLLGSETVGITARASRAVGVLGGGARFAPTLQQ